MASFINWEFRECKHKHKNVRELSKRHYCTISWYCIEEEHFFENLRLCKMWKSCFIARCNKMLLCGSFGSNSMYCIFCIHMENFWDWIFSSRFSFLKCRKWFILLHFIVQYFNFYGSKLNVSKQKLLNSKKIKFITSFI